MFGIIISIVQGKFYGGETGLKRPVSNRCPIRTPGGDELLIQGAFNGIYKLALKTAHHCKPVGTVASKLL